METKAVTGAAGKARRFPSRGFVVCILVLAFFMAGGWLSVDAMSRTKGKLVPGSCTPSEGRYRCKVELIPDGEIVTADSETPVPGGDWVELQVWKPPMTVKRVYTIVAQ